MERDDGKRGESGVLLSLIQGEPGVLRLVLDDVTNESKSFLGPWAHHSLFTSKGYKEKSITSLDLTDKELAEIGFNVLARLGGLREHPIE